MKRVKLIAIACATAMLAVLTLNVAAQDFNTNERTYLTFSNTVELPGIEETDVDVSLADDILTIHGEKKAEKEEKTENRYVVERSYGSFSRSIQVPPGTKPEDITANMAKGVLTVTLPKTVKAQPEAKKIEVKTA